MTSATRPSSRLLGLLVGLCAGLYGADAASAMSLAEALHRAVDRDPTVPLAYAMRDAEMQLGEQERALLRPSLSISGTGNYSQTDSDFAFGQASDNFPSWSAYLRARQALLRLDWSARQQRADIRDALAKDRQDERVRQFIARVAMRYLDTLMAEDTAEQAQSEARAVRESLGDVRKRFDVGLVPGTDLKEAQARDDLAQAKLVSANAALEAARDALQEVTGYDRAPLPTLRDNAQYPQLAPAELSAWQDLAMQESAAIVSARHQLELAKTELRSRKVDAMPSADLVGEVGRNDSKEYVLGQRQDDAKISVELSIPIYSGGMNRSRVLEAEARVREAEADLRRVTMEMERTVRTQFRDVETARSEAQAYNQVLSSAIAAEAATRAGYDAGTRTITDVLDAKSRVVQARQSRNAAGYDYLIRLLMLNGTAGQLTGELLANATDPLLVPR